MFDQSIVKVTGQGWKLAAMMLALLIGGALLVYGVSHLDETLGGRVLLAGVLLVAAGAVFSFTAFRCPQCRANWGWTIASKRDHTSFPASLFTMTACSECGYDGPPTDEANQLTSM